MDFHSLSLTNADFVFLRSSASEQEVDLGMSMLHPHLKSTLSESEISSVRKKVQTLAATMKTRWQRASRTEAKFLAQNLTWLRSPVQVLRSLIAQAPVGPNAPNPSEANAPGPSDANAAGLSSTNSLGTSDTNAPGTSDANVPGSSDPNAFRPSLPTPLITPPATVDPTPSPSIIKHNLGRASRRRVAVPYHSLGPRAKRKRVAKISSAQCETSPLLKATSRTLMARGRKDTAFLIKESMKNPGRAFKMKRRMQCGELAETQKDFTAEDALCLLLEIGLTEANYDILRKACRDRGHKTLFPPYYHVRNAKAKCRPSVAKEDITETQAQVKLQTRMDHSAARIVEMQTDVITQAMATNGIEQMTATLVGSWGMDGSTGHSIYKQLRFSGMAMQDSWLFATTMVPLQLRNPNNPSLPFWHNKRAQSSSFCRPIKLQFVKEDEALIRNESAEIQHQIDNFKPYVADLGSNRSIEIKYEMYMTLIDGKVLNYMTNTNSTQRCPLCYACPSQFNNIDAINSEAFVVSSSNLKYGASPLHAWIRFFECCLKISYKKDIEAWKAETEHQKQVVAAKKQYIQKEMLEEFDLIVDQPKPGGAGSTNDGNTARRAFQEAERFAEVLGLEKQLVKNFRVILLTINSQLPINAAKFGQLCKETALIYVTNYPWYYMPATVHKILLHGKAIVESSILPVGMFGEDAAESRNKLYKYYRLHHTRKISRLATMTDLFHRAMDTSDPLLSSKRQSSMKERIKRLQMIPEVIELLEAPTSKHVRPTLDMTPDPELDFEIADELDFMLDVEAEVEIPTESLRKLIIPQEIELKFLELAQVNTANNIETCGILVGESLGVDLCVTHLIIPSQSGTANSCTSNNEEEVLNRMSALNVIQLGWIHTHPTQTSFLSSVDLHTHLSYQTMLAESVAIVCAPKYQQCGIFHLTESGIEVLRECRSVGHHPHPEV